jgi:hypothetical protein
MFTEDTATALLDEETHEAINIDRTKGDFTFPERNKFDAGWGLSSATVDYICDVKQDPDWVREFRHKALAVFESKPTPTNWATKDLENIDYDKIRFYLSDGEKPKRSWDDVPADVKAERAQSIMEVQQEISLEKNEEKVGQILKVIIDKKEAGRYLGRTEFDSVEVDNEVVINTKKKLTIGDFVWVKITKAYDYDIEGELVDSEGRSI